MKYTIDVTDHGIKGDGVTDDTDAIVNLLKTVRAEELEFPAGCYAVRAELRIVGRSIRGQSINARDQKNGRWLRTIFRAISSGECVLRTDGGCAELSHFAVDATGCRNGIHMLNAHGARCDRVEVKDAVEDGWMIEDPSLALFERCIARNNGGSGFRVVGGNAKRFSLCIGAENAVAGIELQGEASGIPGVNQAGHTLVESGDWSRNGRCGIWLRGVEGSRVVAPYIEGPGTEAGIEISERAHHVEIVSAKVSGPPATYTAYRVRDSLRVLLESCNATGEGRIVWSAPADDVYPPGHERAGETRDACVPIVRDCYRFSRLSHAAYPLGVARE